MTRESAEAALLAYGLGITLVGVAAGLAGAIGLTRFLQSLLFNITASDPITYLNIAALFGAVTMLASSVPARKAMRVDPAIMLRNE
jgi:ABC-type antimicrobial peptide transport system permease subunit